LTNSDNGHEVEPTGGNQDHELRNLPAMRSMKGRFKDWRKRKSRRPPPGTMGRSVKESDTDSWFAHPISDEEVPPGREDEQGR
jgi:hypothetical protein